PSRRTCFAAARSTSGVAPHVRSGRESAGRCHGGSTSGTRRRSPTRRSSRGDGAAVPDFTSALYLGFRHPSSSLEAWPRLTSGVPAALREPRSSTQVAAALAQLVGAERGLLLSSTLHLFWDLFVALGDRRTSLHVDAHAYPIARWGVERAAARGAPAGLFGPHSAAALERQIRAGGRRPIVLADGYCPGCGPTPLRDYAAI